MLISAPENRWIAAGTAGYTLDMETLPPTAEMVRAYLERDASYDGVFFLGVRTTAVFCRPTCPARKPLPENVEYFPTARAALFAGYRPCKRCRPLEPDDRPEWSAALLADVERDPASRITDADLKASFRDAFARTFGRTPGGRPDGDCVLLSWVRSPLGPLVAGATAAGICLLEFTERRMLEAQLATVKRSFGTPVIPGSNRHLELLETELARYFAGSLRSFSVPLVYPGTPFQRRVWEQLLAIPYGETRSYEQLATAIGAPKAVRAVGRANGLNRISIAIPCHRVINKNGGLCGYGGGLWRKRYLLELERSDGVQRTLPGCSPSGEGSGRFRQARARRGPQPRGTA